MSKIYYDLLKVDSILKYPRCIHASNILRDNTYDNYILVVSHKEYECNVPNCPKHPLNDEFIIYLRSGKRLWGDIIYSMDLERSIEKSTEKPIEKPKLTEFEKEERKRLKKERLTKV